VLEWAGTSDQLLRSLAGRVDFDVAASKQFPRSAKGLVNALKRLTPLLRKHQITFEPPTLQTTGELRGKRVLRLTWPGQQRLPEDQPVSTPTEVAAHAAHAALH